MNKLIPLVLLVIVSSACKPSITPTPTLLLSTIMPSNEATFSISKSTPTVLPTATSISTLEPTVFSTSAVTEGWLVYQNNLLGYEFNYPPQAEISSFGPDSYSPEDIPPDIKFDYFALLQNIYPDSLCVGLEYQTGFLIIKAPNKEGGTFVTCGVTGVGDYDVVEANETVRIGGKSYPARGYKVFERDATATFRNEFFFVDLEDGTSINYGGYWKDRGATYEDYVSVKQTLLQILASYEKTSHEHSCGAGWSQLYPGIFAVVTGGPGDLANRVRSTPDTSSQVVAQLRPGQPVVILEGPACNEGLIFWKVQSDVIPGGQGWTAEGDGVAYYLAPYHP